MRAMEGGSEFLGTPLTQAATQGTSSQGGAPSESPCPFPPARQPASGAESRRGDGEQQPGDQQPDPEQQQPGAAGAAGAGEGAGCTPGGSSSSSSADPAVGGVYAEDAPPQPTLYTGATASIQVQVVNIHNDHKARPGVSTYQTTWKNYRRWYSGRYGCVAPTCPYTGFLWVDITLGISFISWMAAQKMTQSQVTCFSSLMPSTRSHLMLPFDATYPCRAFQMSSARSALNYLLNAQHQIALIGAPSSTNPTPRKITTKDSVWVASNYA